jgi:hypothetical protein
MHSCKGVGYPRRRGSAHAKHPPHFVSSDLPQYSNFFNAISLLHELSYGSHTSHFKLTPSTPLCRHGDSALRAILGWYLWAGRFRPGIMLAISCLLTEHDVPLFRSNERWSCPDVAVRRTHVVTKIPLIWAVWQLHLIFDLWQSLNHYIYIWLNLLRW